MIVLFLLLVLCSFWFISQMSAKTMQKVEDYDCSNVPPGKASRHKWVLKFSDGRSDHMGYLICKKCGKMPGDDT